MGCRWLSLTKFSDAAIANAILSLGESLHLTVIAEGIERIGQLKWLRSRGCDEAQGFLLSRPLPAHELESRFLHPQADHQTLRKLLSAAR